MNTPSLWLRRTARACMHGALKQQESSGRAHPVLPRTVQQVVDGHARQHHMLWAHCLCLLPLEGLRARTHPVLPRPVQQVVDDQALHHRVLGRIVGAEGAAADAAVGLQAVVVAGHELVEHRVPAMGACAGVKTMASSHQ
jgi:hypothetical protein